MTFKLSTVYDGNVEWLEERTIFLTKYGSHAYGTATLESDLDLRGVCIAPMRTRLGFLEKFDMVRHNTGKIDLEIYDLPKFLHGCAEGHPNLLEVLFTDLQDHLIGRLTLAFPTWQLGMLLKCREFCLSKKVRHSFAGFAWNQYKRAINQDAKTPEGRKHIGKRVMHIHRLYRSAMEVLRGEPLLVRRPDAEELLAIRNGDPEKHLSELADTMRLLDSELDSVASASNLPREPDRKEINRICMNIIWDYARDIGPHQG